jgi:four helix bundle protein
MLTRFQTGQARERARARTRNTVPGPAARDRSRIRQCGLRTWVRDFGHVPVRGLDLLFGCPVRPCRFVCMFEHERLQVYQLARELNREICRLTKIASKGCADHIDQIVRCGASIPRNLAEGSGEWSPKEKAKFYRYARRSATECCAALDVMVDYEMLRESDVAHAKDLLARIIPMLIKLIKLFEGGGPDRSGPRTSPGSNPKYPARAHSP